MTKVWSTYAALANLNIPGSYQYDDPRSLFGPAAREETGRLVAIGIQRKQRRYVVRCDHAERGDTDKLTRVFADLVG